MSIFDGKVAIGFSNTEEKRIWFGGDRFKSLGGKYEKADELWGTKVAHSGNLFTRQDPASTRQLAEEILNILQGEA